MGKEGIFSGFERRGTVFLNDLSENNDKKWFNENKERYNKYVLIPAQNFVVDMGKRLADLSPKIIADPRVDKSIFRIYRDTRFSTDKRPYKTHIGIYLWEGNRRKMECSGFYLQIAPPYLLLASGLHIFSKPLLDEYRRSVTDKRHGVSLRKAVEEVLDHSDYALGGNHYKRVPRGLNQKHKNAEFLLHNGLYTAVELKIPRLMYSEELLDFCYDHYKRMLPIHKWLVLMTNRAK